MEGQFAQKCIGWGLMLAMGVSFVSCTRPRMTGDHSPEQVAAEPVRTICTSLITYSIMYEKKGYPRELKSLGPPADGQKPGPEAANLVDAEEAAGKKGGYVYTYAPGPPDRSGAITSFILQGRPIDYGKTGRRSFFMDETGVIRYTDEDRAATAADKKDE